MMQWQIRQKTRFRPGKISRRTESARINLAPCRLAGCSGKLTGRVAATDALAAAAAAAQGQFSAGRT